MSTNLINMSIDENDVESHVYSTKSISKGKSNNKCVNKNNNKRVNKSIRKGNNKTVKNVSRTKIIRKIKERKTDNRRIHASIYKNERLNSYYSPVENNHIEDNDDMDEIRTALQNNNNDDENDVDENDVDENDVDENDVDESNVDESNVDENDVDENDVDESNVEFHVYTKAFKQHQNRTKTISKGKSNNKHTNKHTNKSNIKRKNKSNRKSNKKTKDTDKTVKNVSRSKIIRKIKERKIDNRRMYALIYKNERLNSYYSPVENNRIEDNDDDAMNEIWTALQNNNNDDEHDRFHDDFYLCFC